MRIKNQLMFFSLIISFGAQAQILEWTKTLGGSSFDNGQAICEDQEGNLYSTGFFYSILDFDPSSDEFILSSTGNNDIFIQKLSASGEFLWAKSIGGNGFDRGSSICVDNLGNVYVTGSFSGVVDFDPSEAEFNFTSSGDSDIFILKLDTSGNLLWARVLGGTGTDEGRSITTDSEGNVYTLGVFENTVDFDPSASIENISSNGSYDVFIQKFDSNGSFIWVKTFGGVFEDGGAEIEEAGGYIFVLGYFQDIVDFNQGGESVNHTSSGLDDVFVYKLDLQGNYSWVKCFGGQGYDIPVSIAFDASENIFTTGFYYGNADFDPGVGESTLSSYNASLDCFIQKMDSSGIFLWAKSFGGGLDDTLLGLTVDSLGSVYTTGTFRGTADFNPGFETENLISNGETDIFVLKLDNSGELIWVLSYGGDGFDIGNDIVINSQGKIYVIGTFSDTVDFNSSQDVNEFLSVGESDIFIQKLGDLVTGVYESSFGKLASIFPNPSLGRFNIDLDFEEKNIEVTLFDAQGKEVYFNRIMANEFNELNVTQGPGIYFLKLNSTTSQAVFKLIVD